MVVLDRNGPRSNCSAGNAGWIAPSFSAPLPQPGRLRDAFRWILTRKTGPLLVDLHSLPALAPWLWRFARHCGASEFRRGLAALARLNRPTMQLYDRLAADGIGFEMHADGILFAFLRSGELERDFGEVAHLEEFGFQPPERLSGDDVRDLEPALDPAVVGGFFLRRERHVRPESLLEGVTEKLKELEVEFRHSEAALRLVERNGAVEFVETEKGTVAGDVYILAAGAHSGELARSVGTHLPVQAGKGYGVTWQSSGIGIRRPLYLGDAKVACSPFHDALRISGLLELSGVNDRFVSGRIQRLLGAARPYLRRELRTMDRGRNGRSEWMGLRPLTPDGLPIIGRLARPENVFVATGHGMLGLTLGPVTGRATAALADGVEPEVDLAPFAPDRFRL